VLLLLVVGPGRAWLPQQQQQQGAGLLLVLVVLVLMWVG
jgi:hypothetical protein